MDSKKIDPEILNETMEDLVLSDPRYITFLSLIILLFTIIFWWFISRKRQQRNLLLLTGLSDSGKTLLFVQLVYSQYRETFTSIKENIEEYLVSNRILKVVDIPGHERLRNKFFDQYKNNAKAIVYVVDSVSIQKEIRDVAEYLYNILTDSVIQKNCPPLIILCNKQDEALAKGAQVIKTLLEKELNLVRITKSSRLESVDPSQSNKTTYLGKPDMDFEFSQLTCKVDVVEGSVNTGDDDHPVDLKSLEDWIAKL